MTNRLCPFLSTLFAFVLLLPHGAEAQQPGRHASLPSWNSVPDSVPPKFLGHNLRTIHKTYFGLRRGEFESTSEFATRIGVSDSVVFGVFVPFNPTNCVVGACSTYDPDSEEFFVAVANSPKTLGLPGEGPNDDRPGGSLLDDGSRSFQLLTTRTRLGNSAGSNAFGVRRTITKVQETIYGLRVGKSTGGTPPVLQGSTRFIVPRQYAKAVKANMGVLAVFTPWFDGPNGYAIARWDYDSPTVSAPTETSTRYYYVNAMTLEFLIIDMRNRQILGRIKIE